MPNVHLKLTVSSNRLMRPKKSSVTRDQYKIALLSFEMLKRRPLATMQWMTLSCPENELACLTLLRGDAAVATVAQQPAQPEAGVFLALHWMALLQE